MKIEFNFKKNKKLKAQGISEKIEKILKNNFSNINYNVLSVTSMSKWFIVLMDFPNLLYINDEEERMLDAIAGAIVYVLEGNVRYRHYEIHGKTRSLIYHKEWEKESYE